MSIHPTRKHIRLPNFDYTLPADYFVTAVTQNRAQIFGRINDSCMELNDLGKIVMQEWQKTAQLRPEIDLGAFVVMPNHFHGIIRIIDFASNESSNEVGSRRAV
jgi:REP element-mobilizing transposase RayT